MHSISGATIPPPAEREYAVEPVGVAMMMPSAEYSPTSSRSSPRSMASRMTRANPPLWRTASFSAMCSPPGLPRESMTRASSVNRVSSQ